MVYFEHKSMKEKKTQRKQKTSKKSSTKTQADIVKRQDCRDNTEQTFVNNTMKNGK